jgi:hypothetical protein
MKKWANELCRDFSNEQVQMAKNHMKKCSSSLATMEMQMKTILRLHLTPLRMASINKWLSNNKCWQGCRENRTFIHCW